MHYRNGENRRDFEIVATVVTNLIWNKEPHLRRWLVALPSFIVGLLADIFWTFPRL